MSDAPPSLPQTIDELALSLSPEVVLKRWLALLVDTVIWFGIFLVPDYLLGNERYQETLAVWLALAVIYYPAAEWLWGRTPGKFAVGLVVVGAEGNHPTLVQALIRFALRLVEANPFLAGGVPAGIVALVSKRRQRLGDMAARTYVLPLSQLNAFRQRVRR